jgi:hypothetical protein
MKREKGIGCLGWDIMMIRTINGLFMDILREMETEFNKRDPTPKGQTHTNLQRHMCETHRLHIFSGLRSQ